MVKVKQQALIFRIAVVHSSLEGRVNLSVFRKIDLREVRDNNCRVLNQIRFIGSLPIIYRELNEDFPKIFQIFSGNIFC